MRFATGLAILILLTGRAIAEGQENTPLTVALKAAAVSSGEQVLLSEIADLTPDNEKLHTLAVVRAPLPGQWRTVVQAEVLAAIRKGGEREAQFKGALECKVTAAAQSIGGHELAEAAGLTIKKEFEKDPDFEVQTDAGNLPPDMIVRPGPYELQCDLPDGGVHPGYQTLRVHIIQNGKRVAESSCSMTARVTCTVAVATERLASGEILEAGSFKSIRREVSAAELKERCNAEKLCGLRAKQSIGADQLLTKSQFALPLVIRRGESVRILVRRGTLELTAVGQARNDASVDEPVRVFVSDSGAEIVARTSGLREACLDDPLADSRKLETHR